MYHRFSSSLKGNGSEEDEYVIELENQKRGFVVYWNPESNSSEVQSFHELHFRKRKGHNFILRLIFQVYLLANADPKSVLHALWLSKYLEESKFRFNNELLQQEAQQLIAMSDEKATSLWDSLAGAGWDVDGSTLEDLCGPLTLYNIMEEVPTNS